MIQFIIFAPGKRSDMNPTVNSKKICLILLVHGSQSVLNFIVPLITLLAFRCGIPTVLGRVEKTDRQNTSLSIVAGKYGHRPTFHCFIFGKTVRKLNRKNRVNTR